MFMHFSVKLSRLDVVFRCLDLGFQFETFDEIF